MSLDNTEAVPKTVYERCLISMSERRPKIHAGWRKIFDEMLVSLKMVQCKKRDSVRLKFQLISENEFEIECFYLDPVLNGILRKAKAKSRVTCSRCGARGKPLRLNGEGRFFCTSCAGLTKFKDEMTLILEAFEKSENSAQSRVWTEQELGTFLPYVFTTSEWANFECDICAKSVKFLTSSTLKSRLPRIKNLLHELDVECSSEGSIQ